MCLRGVCPVIQVICSEEGLPGNVKHSHYVTVCDYGDMPISGELWVSGAALVVQSVQESGLLVAVVASTPSIGATISVSSTRHGVGSFWSSPQSELTVGALFAGSDVAW